MDVQIVLETGPAIRLESRPDQGTSHEVHYGTLLDSGASVVIKLERTAGALEREASALTAIGAEGRLAANLIHSGFASVGGERTRCLVIERCAGSPPVTIDGWGRMGHAIGRLSNVPPPRTGLPIVDARTFGRQHARRVHELGKCLDSFTGTISDWPRLAAADLPDDAPLVITHGDPGPGNFLDNGTDGVLIDWELAHIAPQGLDLARVQFIARLGAGPAGYVARERQARASAASEGYLDAAPRLVKRSREASRWWTAVAAIQFVHRRWELGGHPAPWEDAAQVLMASLS